MHYKVVKICTLPVPCQMRAFLLEYDHGYTHQQEEDLPYRYRFVLFFQKNILGPDLSDTHRQLL